MQPMIFSLLSHVMPGLAARIAEELFCTPPHITPATGADALLNSGKPFTVDVMGNEVSAWSWGRGPLVYLVHGWGEQTLSLARLVKSLESHNYQVVGFDAPGHGRSEGRISSGIHFTAALHAVVDHVGPAYGVIAHSIGATAAAFALRKGLVARRAVFLGAAADPLHYLRQFLAVVGLPSRLWPTVERRLEQRFDFRWRDLIVENYASRMTARLLAIHDRDDYIVPWSDSASIVAAWPNAKLITTKGLGHRGPLRSSQVVRYVQEFLSG